MQSFTAAIPPALQEADEILTKYGRWAVSLGGPRTCGSAEGDYRPPGGMALEARREPSMPLTLQQRVAAQKALARTPAVNREVLAILYVPHRLPISARLRLARIPARTCQERHGVGLQIWWNLYVLPEPA